MPALPPAGGLSAAWLKYFAAFFMLVDHIEVVFGVSASLFPGSLMGYLLRYLGRFSFPIFAFFIVEGCRKTHDFPSYLKRLAFFALVPQLAATLATGIREVNVICTFFLGALGIYCYQHLRPRMGAGAAAIPAICLAALAIPLQADYGWMGVMIVFTLYLCGEERRRQLWCLGGWMFPLYVARYAFQYWQEPLSRLFSGGDPAQSWAGLQSALPLYLTWTLPYSLFMALSALVPVALLRCYNGRRGRGGKWFFYWFYPLHLLALWGLKLFIEVI